MIRGMDPTTYPPLGDAPAVPLEQVEWRVDGKPTNGRNNGKVSRFVPYIDAAIIAGLLDTWVGPGRWSDAYEPGELGGKPVLWCYLSIEVAPGQWVTKRDVGKPSSFEAEKGTVSDAFKRAACLKWGAGRNVYALPGDLWAPCKVIAGTGGKENAYPTADTVPALLRQLTERGFTPEGVKVLDAPTDDTPEPAASTGPADTGTDGADSDTRLELMEMFNALDQATRAKVLDRLRTADIIKRKTNGAIGTVDAVHFDVVRATLEKAHQALTGSPTPGEAEGGEPPAEEGPPAGSPPPSAPVDEETGEAWSNEAIIAGIEQYRTQLNDTERAAWLGWLAENQPGKAIEKLDRDGLFDAYYAIADLAAGNPPADTTNP